MLKIYRKKLEIEKTQNTKLNSDIKDLNAKIKDLNTKAKTAQNELNNIQSKINNEKDLLQEKENQKSSIRIQIKFQRENKELLIKTKQSLTDELNELKTFLEVKTAEEIEDNIKDSVKKLQDEYIQYKEIEGQASKSEKEKEKLTSSLNDTKKKLLDTKPKLKLLEKDVKALEETLEQLDKNYNEEVKQLQEDIHLLSNLTFIEDRNITVWRERYNLQVESSNKLEERVRELDALLEKVKNNEQTLFKDGEVNNDQRILDRFEEVKELFDKPEDQDQTKKKN